MTCPRCSAEFETEARSCPECGLQLVRNVSGVMKTSSVMIAAGEGPMFYRSVQDVPEPLRTQLIESTHGSNSGTIVIADRAGKDQITQVIARREGAKTREEAAKEQNEKAPAGPDRERDSHEEIVAVAEKPEMNWHALPGVSFLGMRLVVWAGLILFLAALALIVSVFLIH